MSTTSTLDVEAASLKDLQAEARKLADSRDHSKTWIASATKAALVEYIKGGAKPSIQPPTASTGGMGGESAPASNGGDLAAMIAGVVAPLVKASSIDESAVRALVADEVAKATLPRPVSIKVGDREPVKFDTAHPVLEDVISALSCELHVWLTGPAGSGKTTVASMASKALGLDFGALSVSAQTPVSALMGYMNATGDYVSTVFRKCFEHGGVFVLDEADNGNPNVLAVLNAALANGLCSFPDGNVKRHKEFRVVACANTYGQGPDAQYVGRQKLDAATLDRFVFLVCGYDESLEDALAPDKEWVARVRSYRAASEKLGIKTVIGPRASIYGCRLLASGWKRDKVEAALIFKGLSADSVNKLKAAVK